MIKKVKFNNFYSFKEEQEIDFTVQKKNTYDYFSSKSGKQITKVACFIGGNAAGKTNVMRLLSFLRHFVCNSSKENTASSPDIAFKTFFNNKDKSNFYIEFEKNNQIFFYEFSVKDNEIIKEVLYLKKIKKYSHKRLIFVRNNNALEEFDSNYLTGFKKEFLKNIRSDISLIAFLKSHYSIDIINLVYDYFFKLGTNLNERGQIYNSRHKLDIYNLYLNDVELKKEMEDFVSHFDIGLKGFEIDKEVKNDQYKISIQGIHSLGKDEGRLDFDYESRGTQSLFFTLANILHSLKKNSVTVIDEIEFGFHPEALSKLISYFIDECENKSAQLIFSSHSFEFINKLDAQQIYLVDKNEGKSFSYRLSQVENVRSDENFLSKYMTGAYGAFPKIRV